MVGGVCTVTVAVSESLTSGSVPVTVAVLVMSPAGVLAGTVTSRLMVSLLPGANCAMVACIVHRSVVVLCVADAVTLAVWLRLLAT